MVVVVFLSGPPPNSQISSTHFMFCQLWPRPFVCDASLYLYNVLGCGGQFGLCHPITVQGTGSLGCPFFFFFVWVACGWCCRPGEHLLLTQDQGARQNKLHRGCK